MKVLFFIFPLVMFLGLNCTLTFGNAYQNKNDSSSLEAMSSSQKQHTQGTGEILSNLSQKEREWYQKFQDGLMFFSGWKEISENILKELPPDERHFAEQLLENMGVRIGTEWSKHNDIRRIDTGQLRSWGDRLRKARKKGDTHLSQTVRDISAEVDELLSRPRTPGKMNNS